MKIKLIKSDTDYREALKRLEGIFDAVEGSLESNEADLLAQMISEYEIIHFPIDI